MRWCGELGVIDTIYEDDDEGEREADCEEYKSSYLNLSITTVPNSPRSSSSSSSTPSSLYEKVDKWSGMSGCKPDVFIRLHERCFYVHKEPLESRSRYLRRHLTESNDITVDPPQGITADVFAEAVGFCYDSSVNLTPANLAAIRIVAEWLEIDSGGGVGGWSLTWQTEIYFRRAIAWHPTNASCVLRACFGLLEEGTAALLAAMCVQVLASQPIGGAWLEELTALEAVDFMVVAQAMSTWFEHDHDLLYRIVDVYLEDNGELTEGDKSMVCHPINPAKLSADHLFRLVKNPRFPVRFIARATLLNRHAPHHISSSSATTSSALISEQSNINTSLNPLIRHEVEASDLRTSMQATSLRIENLERDLEELKVMLMWSEEKRAEKESARRSWTSVGAVRGKNETAVSGKVFGRRLVDGLRGVFKTSPAPATSKGKVAGGGEKRLLPGLTSIFRN